MRTIARRVLRTVRGDGAAHAHAIQELQQQHAALVEQLRLITDDLAGRVANTTDRIDMLERRVDHVGEAIDEVARVVAPVNDRG